MTQHQTVQPSLTLPALGGGQTGVSADELSTLRGRLQGDALTPTDPGYNSVRAVFNPMHTDRPNLVVRCANTADVVEAVNFARRNAIAVTIRGGGHSIAGLSSSVGGMVIDLALMSAVDVDVAGRTVRVQGGALWADLDRATQPHGLATPGGMVSDTGVAGLTLGGGYGWLRRKHGLSSDNLLAAEVVCADGRVRTASADTNADLFWAIRGGGGNFGIVTSFTFRLHPVGPDLACGTLFYPVEDAVSVLRGYRDYCDRAPDEVSSEAIAITMPAAEELPEEIHDRACLVLAAVFSGDPDEGMAALQPLRELGSPLVDASQPTPYTVVQSDFDAFFQRQTLHGYWKSLYLPALSDEAIDVLAEKAQTRPAPLSLVDVMHMGGAVGRVGPTETAFAERSAPFLASIDGMWSDPADSTDNVAWVRTAWEDLRKFGTGSTYLNFTGQTDEPADTGIDDAYGRNLRRLAEVKAVFDPDNFFRANNNIVPSPRSGQGR